MSDVFVIANVDFVKARATLFLHRNIIYGCTVLLLRQVTCPGSGLHREVRLFFAVHHHPLSIPRTYKKKKKEKRAAGDECH